jgi:hypothetical protein
VLYGQLRQFPNDFFTQDITDGNFIIHAITTFTEIITEYASNPAAPQASKLKARLSKLHGLIKDKFHIEVKQPTHKTHTTIEYATSFCHVHLPYVEHYAKN